MLDPSKKLPREIPTAPPSDTIDVAKWIAKNYDPFDGQFTPSSATERTKALLREVEDKQNKEIAKGGVLCCDSKTPSTILSHGVGYIADDCVLDSLIVGLQTTKMLERTMKLKGGTRMVEKALKENGERMDPFTKKVFEQNVRTHNECVFDLYTPEMRLVRSAHALTGLPDSYGRGRLIGDYRRVALYGLDRLIEEKQRDAARLDISQANESNMEKKDKIAMQIRALHSLDMLAKQYGKNISKPATTAKEAAQAIYFAYLAVVKSNDGAAISFGRVDAFLDIYFEHDFRTGVLASEDEAQEIIDNLVLKLRLVRHLRPKAYDEIFAGDPIWATNAIAGVLEDANHGTKKHMVTKTSYRFLQTLVNLGAAPEPNMTVLFDECLPEGFKKFATDISITSSSVQYINDKLLRENWSCDTTVSCCVSGMRLGKDAQFFGARCNLPKILLYALNDGKDEISGNQIAPIELAQQFESLAEKAQTDENSIHLDYEDVKKRFETYMDWIAALYVSTMNVIHFSHEKYAYESLLYALMDSEPDYNMAFGIAGLSVLVDSLSAIKHAKVRPIFSEETDMKGIITSFDVKRCNDSDDVDELAKWVVNTFIEKLRKTPAFKNAKHTLSILTITSNVMYGSNTGATPDGRKLGEAFAPGANPMHGRDDTGALNSLNSVAKVPYGACLDGISNTFSITKGSLGKDDGSRTGNLGSLLAGYFEKGAMHLNVNVLSRDTLKDAQIHPENYPNLTIRVSGYAVKFIKLSKAHQDEVISRTFHEFM